MDEPRPHKIRVPLSPRTPVAQVEAVLANGPFLAFARILGLRIMRGNSAGALRMLRQIGASGAQGYTIIDGWAQAFENVDISPMLSPTEAAAVYFSRFVDDLTRYDWIEVLQLAVADSREEGSSSVNPPADGG